MNGLPLLGLRFSLQVDTEAQLPAYKGDVLRRALLWRLSKMWCRRSERCRHGCEEPNVCLFGRLVFPEVDANWSISLRRMIGTTPPPAYVLWDLCDRRRTFVPGDEWRFDLTLIGKTAIEQFPAFIAAVIAAGEQGWGRDHMRTHLMRVEATGKRDSVALLQNGVWQGKTPEYLSLLAAPEFSETEGPLSRLHMRFLSPLKVKLRGREVRYPKFIALARAVVRRLRVLSEVYGTGPWPHEEWGPLLDLAETVRLEHHEVLWVDARRSSRRGVMPLDGFVGQAWYVSEESLSPLLPILWLGQWVHAGKGATWGNGRYAVEVNR